MSTSRSSPLADAPSAAGPPAHPVAEKMERVHAELRAGRTPSFEALLAYGVPAGPSAA